MNSAVQKALFGCFFALSLFSGCKTVARDPASQNDLDSMQLAGTSDKNADKSVTPTAVAGSSGTLLAVPGKDQLKKNAMDAAILANLEIGSPAGIRAAVERIDGDTRGMTDSNRIALAVAYEMMSIMYPLESVSWTMPAVPDTGSYIGAIRSARMGVYDYNTGNSDFLARVLPSLVMVISSTPGDYYTDAEAALVKLVALNEKSVLPLYFLGLLAERQKKDSIAADYYRKAWELDSSCYPAGIGFARSLIQREQGAQALVVARSLLTRFPENLQMIQLCAEAAFAMKDWNAADPYVLKALKMDSDNTHYLLMRARILVEHKEYFKANSLLDAFATTNRTDKSYLLLRSRVIREWNKNLASAIAVLQDAQRLYPDDIDVLLSSAEVCYQSGSAINQLMGRDFVQAALSKDGDNRTAMSLLVLDYIHVNEWTEAIKLGERLVSLYPSDDTRILLVRAYLGASQPSRAAALAKILYSVLTPSDEVTGLYLQALVDAGDTRTAATILSSRMDSASASLKSVLFYHESRMASNPESELSSLRSSLLSDSRNSASLFAMYQWYYEKADYRKAEYYLKQVIALNPSNAKYVQLLAKLTEQLAR